MNSYDRAQALANAHGITFWVATVNRRDPYHRRRRRTLEVTTSDLGACAGYVSLRRFDPTRDRT